MKRTFFALSLAVIMLTLSPFAAHGLNENRSKPAVDSWEADALAANRTALVYEILKERQIESGRTFDRAWADQMQLLLSESSLEELEVIREQGGGAPDLNHDLVFNPLDTPCRFYDSRNTAAGRLTPGGGDRSFNVRGAIPPGQGGAADCDVPSKALAVVVNVLAVSPLSQGNFQMWPADGNPGDSVINYGGPSLGINLINGVMVPICDIFQGACSSDLILRTNFASSHAVVNVTGYFSPPEAKPLDCVTRQETQSFTNEAFDFNSPNCPRGFTLTGGGHNWFRNLTDVWFWEVSPQDNHYHCRGTNNNAGVSEITCFARCCRTPGLGPIPEGG